MYRFLSVLLVFFVLSCGGSLRVEPLVGEDAAVVKFIRSKYPPRRDVRVIRRLVIKLHNAIKSDKFEVVWNHLSAATQAHLASIGKSRGISSMAVLKSGKIRKTDGRVSTNLMDWLLINGLKRITGELSGVTQKTRDINEGLVYLIDNQSNFRVLRLYRERKTWKIHPAF